MDSSLPRSRCQKQTEVTRTALHNAASIAGLLLTTESVVVERPEKDKAPSMPGGGGMGDMY